MSGLVGSRKHIWNTNSKQSLSVGELGLPGSSNHIWKTNSKLSLNVRELRGCSDSQGVEITHGTPVLN